MAPVKLILVLVNLLTTFKTTKMEVTNKVKAFSCLGKVIGGYYADVQSNCQMFHVCTLGVEGEIRDIVFRCLNGTVFNQETRVCDRESEVDCSLSEEFYKLNNELYGPGIIPDSANILKLTDEEETLGQTSGLRKTQIPLDSLNRDMKTEISKEPSSLTSPQDASLETSRPNAISLAQREDALSCEGKIPGAIYVDVHSDCRTYFLCKWNPILKSTVMLKYICPKKGQRFDPVKGTCTFSKNVRCSLKLPPFLRLPPSPDINQRKYIHLIEAKDEQLEVLCSYSPTKGLIADIKSNCKRYFRCTRGPKEKLRLQLQSCPHHLTFSQSQLKCTDKRTFNCVQEALLVLSDLKYEQYNPIKHLALPHVSQQAMRTLSQNRLRRKRNLPIENRNSRGEATRESSISGMMTDLSPIVKHEAPQNVHSRQGKSNISNKKCRQEIPKPHTIFEICEINSIIVSSLLPVINTNKNGNVKKDSITTNDEEKVNNGDSLLPVNETANQGESLPASLNSTNDSSSSQYDENLVTTTDLVNLEDTTTNNFEANKDGMDSVTIIPNNLSSLSDSETQLVEDELASSSTDTSILSSTILTTTTEGISNIPQITTASTIEFTTKTRVESSSECTPNGNTITNFTCKDKELNKLYPDIETECRVFHYCSPGEDNDLVFDFKFECTCDNRFDVETQKCQDKSLVKCEHSSATIPCSSSSTSPCPSTSTMTTTSSTTTSSTTTPSTTTPITTTTTPSTTTQIAIVTLFSTAITDNSEVKKVSSTEAEPLQESSIITIEYTAPYMEATESTELSQVITEENVMHATEPTTFEGDNFNDELGPVTNMASITEVNGASSIISMSLESTPSSPSGEIVSSTESAVIIFEDGDRFETTPYGAVPITSKPLASTALQNERETVDKINTFTTGNNKPTS